MINSSRLTGHGLTLSFFVFVTATITGADLFSMEHASIGDREKIESMRDKILLAVQEFGKKHNYAILPATIFPTPKTSKKLAWQCANCSHNFKHRAVNITTFYMYHLINCPSFFAKGEQKFIRDMVIEKYIKADVSDFKCFLCNESPGIYYNDMIRHLFGSPCKSLAGVVKKRTLTWDEKVDFPSKKKKGEESKDDDTEVETESCSSSDDEHTAKESSTLY